MRHALMISAAVATFALVLPQTSGSAGATQLPLGSIQTPIVPSARSWWGHAGPLVAGAAGTLFGDGTVRSSLRPTHRVPVAAPLGPRLSQSSGSSAVANDSDAGLITGASPIAGTGTLWRVGLATGKVESRRLTLGSAYRRLLGLTPTAWVLLLPDGAARLVPFGRSATTLLKPPQLVGVLSAGSRGITYLARTSALAASPYTWELRLVSPNLSVTTVLGSGAARDGAAPQVDVVMAQGAVSWLSREAATGFANQLGYWTSGTGTTRASASTLSALDPPPATDLGQYGLRAVVPGSVALTAYQWGGATLATWRPGVDALTPRGGPSVDPTANLVTRVWPSRTTAGVGSFAGVVQPNTETDGTNDAEFWVRWPVSSGATQVIARGPAQPARLLAAIGTNGRVLLVHQATFSSPGRTAVYVRAIGRTGTTPILSAPGASPAAGVNSLSGTRSAILAPYTAWFDAVVLRNGARMTGRVLVPVGNRTRVSTSGPYTAIATEGTTTSFSAVYAANGRRVAVLPQSQDVAQDGSRVLYLLNDGSLWMRDVSRATTSSNPRRLVAACTGVEPPCYVHLWLSGRYAVAYPRFTVRPLVIIDLVRRTTRKVAIGSTFAPDAVNGRTLTGRNVLTGQVVTVDLARAWHPAPVVGVVSSGATTLAGHRLGWAQAGVTRPLIGVPVALRLAPLPWANDRVGAPRLLGPWSTSGGTASSTGPSWVPQWSFTDSVSSWRLVMRSGSGRVVRVWTGSASDGLIRGVVWNGRDLSGRVLLAGTYHWALTGTGPFGAPLDTVGVGVARGLVRVT